MKLDTFQSKCKKIWQIGRGDADPMDMLQAFVSALAGYYDEEFSNKDASIEKAINLISKVPTIIASWQRIRNGLEIIDPDSSLSHAANFLYMMSGEKTRY